MIKSNNGKLHAGNSLTVSFDKSFLFVCMLAFTFFTNLSGVSAISSTTSVCTHAVEFEKNETVVNKCSAIKSNEAMCV